MMNRGFSRPWLKYPMNRKYTRHTMTSLLGQLTCPADHSIHLVNVSVGFSQSSYCWPARPGCMAGSPKATQIMNCQGQVGQCDISINRRFMQRCGRMNNYALVTYECVPAAKRVDICSTVSQDVSDSVVITSPAYPNKPASVGDFATCECTLRTMDGATFNIESLRAHLPKTGETCDGDMLILERPDPSQDGQYLLVSEVCGKNITQDKTVEDNILRMTFLGGSPLDDVLTGFAAKIKAVKSDGSPELYHLTCSGPPGTQASPVITTPKALNFPVPGTTPQNRNEYANRLLEWMKKSGRAPPQGFDANTLPANLFNISQEIRNKLSQQPHFRRMIENNEMPDPALFMPTQPINDKEKSSVDTSSGPGILSGVVASLASVIVIMLCLGIFLFERRRRRRAAAKKALYGTSVYNGGDSVYQSGDSIYWTSDIVPASRSSDVSVVSNSRPGSSSSIPRAPTGPSPVLPGRKISKEAPKPPLVHSVSADINPDAENNQYHNQNVVDADTPPIAPPRRKKTVVKPLLSAATSAAESNNEYSNSSNSSNSKHSTNSSNSDVSDTDCNQYNNNSQVVAAAEQHRRVTVTDVTSGPSLIADLAAALKKRRITVADLNCTVPEDLELRFPLPQKAGYDDAENLGDDVRDGLGDDDVLDDVDDDDMDDDDFSIDSSPLSECGQFTFDPDIVEEDVNYSTIEEIQDTGSDPATDC